LTTTSGSSRTLLKPLTKDVPKSQTSKAVRGMPAPTKTHAHAHTKALRTHPTHRHHDCASSTAAAVAAYPREPPGHLAVPRLHLLAWQHRRLLRASQNGRVVSNCAWGVCSGRDRQRDTDRQTTQRCRGPICTSHQGQHERCSGIYGVYSLVGPCCACVHVCVLCVCVRACVCGNVCTNSCVCARVVLFLQMPRTTSSAKERKTLKMLSSW
jgi:hypothetical protein